jgi:hypothetical protein
MIDPSYSSDALFHEPFCGVFSDSLNRCVKCIKVGLRHDSLFLIL